MDVLEKLLDVQPEEQTRSQSFVTEEDIDLEPDFGGLSLKELASAETDQEDDTSKTPSRQDGVQDCMSRPSSCLAETRC